MNQTLPAGSKIYFACKTLIGSGRNILFLTSNEFEARSAAMLAEFFLRKSDKAEILHLPALPTGIYDQMPVDDDILSARISTLAKISMCDAIPKILITASTNLLFNLAPQHLIRSSIINLEVGQKIDIEDVIRKAGACGYRASENANFAGEFARRGEIFDIVTPANSAYRIYLDFDNIEAIKKFDITTQLSGAAIDKVTIIPASEVIISESTIKDFASRALGQLGAGAASCLQYQQIQSGMRPVCIEYMSKLLYGEHNGLLNYMGDDVMVIYDDFASAAFEQTSKTIMDEWNFAKSVAVEKSQIQNNLFLALSPAEIVGLDNPPSEFSDKQKIQLAYGDSDFGVSSAGLHIQTSSEAKERAILSLIKDNEDKTIIIFCDSKVNQARDFLSSCKIPCQKIENIESAQPALVNLAALEIEYGFARGRHLFLRIEEVLPNLKESQNQQSKKTGDAKKRLENILLELDNFSPGSLVIHKVHGIGQFLGVENVQAGSLRHDCIKILYARGDKLYIPVESIDLIKKYSDDPAAHELDRLGSNAWAGRKKKTKEHLKSIARDLIKLSAKRKMLRSEDAIIDDDAYQNFCAGFGHSPTEDQMRAIDDIRGDLLSGMLMDRLLCGDVGFGKTEVAMRAAFLASSDIGQESAQVAILVPTTVLCRQHYLEFAKRFGGSDIKVAELSRNVTPANQKHTIEALKSGKVQIIIATHALLSEKIQFRNLRLLIIDEEQRFGVKQKEFIKNIKTSVHVLSLSATPIPRTMQMSMTGIKELSLIATPPKGRLAVKSAVTAENSNLLRGALIKEHSRGGLSFYVCPKIKDIADVELILQKTVPDLKYKIMHGRMKPQEIDKTLLEFAQQKFDILLSTTIIESGLDIKKAGTLVVHNADRMGLSQLYQLRGRVGRSSAQAFAYFTVQPSIMNAKSKMQKLEIIRSMNTLGSGFTLASHDMNLRGFGNLVGQEQSGHIKDIGSEMYQEMLSDEIVKIKNQKSDESRDLSPVIKLPLPVFIPESYIKDENLRLSIYRRSAALKSESEIEEFKFEMQDRFGALPNEFDNLLKLIGLKILCAGLGVTKLDAGPKGFLLEFTDNLDDGRVQQLLHLCQKNPNIKMRPPSAIFFASPTSGDKLMKNLGKLFDYISS